jgi:hypothetical protein
MLIDPAPIRIARIIMRAGIEEPDSYICNGVEVVVRELGESLEGLQKRCVEAANWPDACSRLVFYPSKSLVSKSLKT